MKAITIEQARRADALGFDGDYTYYYDTDCRLRNVYHTIGDYKYAAPDTDTLIQWLCDHGVYVWVSPITIDREIWFNGVVYVASGKHIRFANYHNGYQDRDRTTALNQAIDEALTYLEQRKENEI